MAEHQQDRPGEERHEADEPDPPCIESDLHGRLLCVEEGLVDIRAAHVAAEVVTEIAVAEAERMGDKRFFAGSLQGEAGLILAERSVGGGETTFDGNQGGVRSHGIAGDREYRKYDDHSRENRSTADV